MSFHSPVYEHVEYCPTNCFARFDGVAEVYRVVAEDTDLGLEQPGKRKRGTTVDDVVDVMQSGMKAAKRR
jgi:hypothetical protein